MATVHVDKGILSGLELTVYTSEELRGVAEPAHATALKHASFFGGKLERAVFRGMEFSHCGFARAVFTKVSFYKCRFVKSDLVRTEFVNCFFYDCEFEDCDPYYASFKENTEVDPSAFRRCYRADSEWNKALILFSALRRTFRASGDGRLSRIADYYFKVWQRRRLYHRWRHKQLSGSLLWFWNFFLWLLTGYGERPAFLSIWTAGIISALALVYRKWFGCVVPNPGPGYEDYLYFSFRTFFGRGFTETVQTTGVFLVQIFEFTCGLVLVALLIGSITRKLSP